MGKLKCARMSQDSDVTVFDLAVPIVSVEMTRPQLGTSLSFMTIETLQSKMQSIDMIAMI